MEYIYLSAKPVGWEGQLSQLRGVGFVSTSLRWPLRSLQASASFSVSVRAVFAYAKKNSYFSARGVRALRTFGTLVRTTGSAAGAQVDGEVRAGSALT